MPGQMDPGDMGTPGGSQPDLDSFGPAGGGHSAAGQLLGTSQLQTAINQFEKSVEKLGDIVSQMAGRSATFSNNGGFPSMQAAYGALGGTGGMGGTLGSPSSAPAPMTRTASSGGGWQSMPPPASPGGPGYPSPAAPSAAGPSGGATIGGVLGGVFTAAVTFGRANMANQLGINAYDVLGQLQAQGGGSSAYNALNYQAFGSGASNLNILAQNTPDAAAMYANLQSISGSAFPMSNQIGQAAYGATAAFGYLNPGMSGAAASAAAGSMYSPSVSLQMRQLGYMTPRTMGQPGAASTAAIMQNQLTRMFGGRLPSQNQLVQNAAAGGIIQQNLQAEGLNPQTTIPMMEAYNRLLNPRGAGINQKALSAGQAQQLFSTIGSNASRTTLAKYGIDQSDISKIQAANAPLSARQADQSSAFTAGLTTATTALGNFRDMINKILQATGANSVIGFGQGFGGTMGSVGGGALGGLGSIFSMLGISKLLGGGEGLLGKIGGGASGILGKLFGGGGAGAESGISGVADDAAGGAGGSLAGGAAVGGLGIIGTIVKSLLQGQISKIPGIGHLLSGVGNLVSGGGNPVQNMASNASNDILGFFKNVVGGGAVGTITSNMSPATPAPAIGGSSTTGTAARAVSAAESQEGVPYIYGAESPGVGFDCSGLMQWSYAQAGVTMPRTADEQFQFWKSKGREISVTAVQEGDLVYEAGADGTFADPGHTAMMVNPSLIVVADQTGTPVRTRAYSTSEWTHAVRPTGSGSGSLTTANQSTTQSNSSVGNTGLGFGNVVSEEIDTYSEGTQSMGSMGSFWTPSSSKAAATQTAGGGTLTNPGSSRSSFAKALLQAIGAPNNQNTMDSMLVWEIAEGGGFGNQASNNPLNLNPGPGAGWPGHNASGAWAFPNLATGLKYTAQVIDQSNFSSILQAFRSGTSEHSILEAIVQSPWAASHYQGDNEMLAALAATANGGVSTAAKGKSGSQVTLTGERGPELSIVGAGTSILDAAQSAQFLQRGVAQAPPGLDPSGGSMAYSPWHPAYSAGQSSGGGNTVSFGDINITLPPGSIDSNDTGKSGRAMAQAFINAVQKESVYTAIATGMTT
jgi:cell wall-associated NlpC family hydrolase